MCILTYFKYYQIDCSYSAKSIDPSIFGAKVKLCNTSSYIYCTYMCKLYKGHYCIIYIALGAKIQETDPQLCLSPTTDDCQVNLT